MPGRKGGPCEHKNISGDAMHEGKDMNDMNWDVVGFVDPLLPSSGGVRVRRPLCESGNPYLACSRKKDHSFESSFFLSNISNVESSTAFPSKICIQTRPPLATSTHRPFRRPHRCAARPVSVQEGGDSLLGPLRAVAGGAKPPGCRRGGANATGGARGGVEGGGWNASWVGWLA